ncbi:helix-turn-helix domain-containing protein [Microcella sp.]|uniref:TetR/AcrR family transcriptional regulator n=1 Tax=Microcella sp. TaxID=1913979 RepID=UPI00299F5A11|nr:helix-turn-helix domain-containing protein [Microcella sp.]MDX2025916.1 helix-turn-helix domain-containing protein [Microcella sp.]
MSAAPVDSGRPIAPAKQRILDAATTLFSQEGIRAVGVDRLIQQSSVTKATFYKHFGSKDRLIQHYVAAASAARLATLDARMAAHEAPHERLLALVDAVNADLRLDDFRGSLFVNAAAEFPDPRDPVRIMIAEHHDAIAARVTELLSALGHPLPGEAADQIMVAYVGALSWGYVGDPVGASVAFRRSIERVLDDQLAAPRR